MLRSIAKSPLLLIARQCVSHSRAQPQTWRLLATESKQTSEQSGEHPPEQSMPKPNADEASTATEPDQPATPAEPLSQVETLTRQLGEMEAQLADLDDRTLRTLADMENVRTIARRDVENARKYAIMPFAKSILTVADNLGLALSSVDKEHVEAADADPILKGLHVGIGATETELLKVFSQFGISRFGIVGDKFDPNKYQAMFEAESQEYDPGTVINIHKVGYEMGDRVLRPAEVGVSRAP